MMATLVGAFGALALLLATVGVYGIMEHVAAQRRSEIGIRLALGAAPSSIFGLILGEGLRLVAIGTAIGLTAAFATTRYIQTLLFGVDPVDAATFAAVSLILTATATLACLIPARRAMRVDPVVAFREHDADSDRDRRPPTADRRPPTADRRPPTCGTVTGTLSRRTATRAQLPLITFALTLVLRVHGISRHFAMLGDQIRDWGIALGPIPRSAARRPGDSRRRLHHRAGVLLDSLGDPGHRRSVVRQPAAWRRHRPGDRAIGRRRAAARRDLAAHGLGLDRPGGRHPASPPRHTTLRWPPWSGIPMMGAALAKIATALVLLGWPFRSLTGVAVTSCRGLERGALLHRRDLHHARCLHVDSRRPVLVEVNTPERARSAAVIAIVVAVLQMPIVVYQMSPPRRGPAMGAVTGSVGRILTGQARPDFAGSWNGFSGAFTFIQGAPWHQDGWLVWLLVACAIIVAAKHRRDPALLAVTVLPLTLGVTGYAFFVGPSSKPTTTSR